jgi:Flp pilus assembly protein TadG
MSIQFLVILVPVILGTMGFALDLGRIYLVRGELNQAASAMALAAAKQLNGTTAASTAASTAGDATLNDALGDANRYNFGSLVVGQGDALLSATTPAYSLFANLADAQTGGNIADATTAHYVAVNLTADAPLIFWSLFSFGQSRKTPIAAAAIAGLSAPLCTACGIEPFAITAVDASDAQNFGLTAGNLYTLGFQCTTPPGAQPAPLTGTRLPYVLINGYNTALAEAEDQQLFQTGAQGLLPAPFSSTSLSCAAINSAQTLWVSATPGTCVSGANASVTAALCGLSSRLTTAQPAACQNNTNLANVASTYPADIDATYVTDYTTYQGNNRRVMTLPIVDGLASLSVLGFRQFLLEPNPDGTVNNPSDADGRFIVLYLGSVAPVKQGRIDGASCALTSGPGMVVLHQ